MLTLKDGPAKGAYAVTRSPNFLRAVTDSQGNRDVLDQLSDQPTPAETVHVYRRTKQHDEAITMLMLTGTNGSGRRCVPSVVAEYHHMPEIDGETMRDTSTWRAWAIANAPDNEPKPTADDANGPDRPSQEP